jgi:hypothetical protein
VIWIKNSIGLNFDEFELWLHAWDAFANQYFEIYDDFLNEDHKKSGKISFLGLLDQILKK